MIKETTPNTNISNTSSPFRFNDPRQESIYERLGRLVSPGTAAFFKDACRHMALQPSFASTAHLVAHLLREIESSLHDVLESITEQRFEIEVCEVCGQKTRRTAHSNKIRIVSEKLKLSKEVTEGWLSLSGEKGLHKFAHRSGLRPARVIDDNFREIWARMETVFYVVLDNLETHYIEILAKLDELAIKSEPTKEDAQFFCSKIPNNHNTYFHFFSKLISPKWLSLLKKKSVFLEIPGPEYDVENGGVRYPFWSAAVYLEKMARVNPHLVTEILKEVKDVDNAIVKSSLLTIAAKLPKEERLDLVEKIKGWMITEHQFYQDILVEPGTKLINKFVEDREEDIAFQLAALFLEILPDPKWKPKSSEDIYAIRPQPQVRLDYWHYNEFLKKEFQKLVELNSKRAFDSICQLLEDYLKFRHIDREEKDHNYEDLSCMSRPAIEDHEQNRSSEDVENSLITAARDIALKIIEKDFLTTKTLFIELEKRKWAVFYRIGFYLLSEFPDSAKDVVAQQLTNQSFFDNPKFEHEYARLMKKGFRILDGKQKKTILGWIKEAKEITEFIDKRWGDEKEEKKLEIKERWQRDQLSYIKDDLSTDWKARYTELVNKYGESEHPDFPYYTTSGWVGPTSDIGSQQIAEMETDKLIEFLKTWQPKSEHHEFGPTKEGLGRELSAAIKLRPDHFTDVAEKIKNLDPTYVRSYIQGFYELIQQNHKLNWEQILDLCFWVIQQPSEIPGRKGNFMDQDPDWSWTRKAIASLILRGVNENSISYDLREKVWGVLEPLTHDANPKPEEEVNHDGNSIDEDAHTLAINTTRGEAMSAVIEYALWVYRNIKKSDRGEEKINAGFEIVPEVQTILELHLNLESDPSIAVRSVYGRFYPWLLLIDQKWTVSHTDDIFPAGQFGNRLYNAAWDTYVIYVQPYDKPLEVLRERYQEAIQNLGKVDKKRRHFADRDQKLIEHLMVYYWRGKLTLSDDLLQLFWNSASAESRGYALDFLGRNLKNTEITIEKEVLERLKVLWESRALAARKTMDKLDYTEEMSAFGWWFASGKFDDEWSCAQYLEALDMGKKTHSDYFVTKRLKDTINILPLETIKILGKLVLTDQPSWIVIGNKKEISAILSTALHTPQIAAQEEARALINRLVARGYIEFSSLISSLNQLTSAK